MIHIATYIISIIFFQTNTKKAIQLLYASIYLTSVKLTADKSIYIIIIIIITIILIYKHLNVPKERWKNYLLEMIYYILYLTMLSKNERNI